MRGVGKKLAAVLALACAAFGAQSVPGTVLDARQSTVRIVAISGENAFYGTGFTVARNSCYVVTNYHVIEGCSEFEIYLSHDAAVPHSEGHGPRGRPGCAGNRGAPEGAGPCAAHQQL